MAANDIQVGGEHYKGTIQHWDYVIANDLSYLEGQITKYVSRWRKKNGLQDLQKARHFLDKLIEEAEAGRIKPHVCGCKASGNGLAPGDHGINRD
jgi:lipopolysaccharide biosynthesis regulator YciM